MAVAAIAIAFCEYGHNAIFGTRIVSYSANERDVVSSLTYVILVNQKIILLVIATAFIYLWNIWFVQGLAVNKWLLIVVIACVIVPEVLTPTWYYIGTGRLTRLLVYQLIGRAVAFIGAGWLAYQKFAITITGAAFLCGLPFMIGSLLSNQYLWRRIKPQLTLIPFMDLARALGRQSPYFLGTFSSSISPSIFLLLVMTHFTSETLGQYAIAGVAWGALRQLSQLGSNLYLAEAKIAIPQKASSLILRASGLGIFCSVFTMLAIQLIISFFSHEIWFSIDYNLASRYLLLLAASVIFYSINFSIGLYIFCSASQRAKFTLTQAAPVVVFVILSFLWPNLQASDMALLMIVGEFSGLILALFNMRKIILKPMYD